MYLNFYDLSALDGCWSLVSIWRFFYNFFNVRLFDCRAIAGSGKVGPFNFRLTTPAGWLVAPADRPKSVRNSCLIERIWSVFLSFHQCIVCCLGVFVIRLRQISSLFSFRNNQNCMTTLSSGHDPSLLDQYLTTLGGQVYSIDKQCRIVKNDDSSYFCRVCTISLTCILFYFIQGSIQMLCETSEKVILWYQQKNPAI